MSGSTAPVLRNARRVRFAALGRGGTYPRPPSCSGKPATTRPRRSCRLARGSRGRSLRRNGTRARRVPASAAGPPAGHRPRGGSRGRRLTPWYDPTTRIRPRPGASPGRCYHLSRPSSDRVRRPGANRRPAARRCRRLGPTGRSVDGFSDCYDRRKSAASAVHGSTHDHRPNAQVRLAVRCTHRGNGRTLARPASCDHMAGSPPTDLTAGHVGAGRRAGHALVGPVRASTCPADCASAGRRVNPLHAMS